MSYKMLNFYPINELWIYSRLGLYNLLSFPSAMLAYRLASLASHNVHNIKDQFKATGAYLD